MLFCSKNIECSFAKRESFRELLKLVSATILPQEEPSFKVDLQKASLIIIPTAYLVVRLVLYSLLKAIITKVQVFRA